LIEAQLVDPGLVSKWKFTLSLVIGWLSVGDKNKGKGRLSVGDKDKGKGNAAKIGV